MTKNDYEMMNRKNKWPFTGDFVNEWGKTHVCTWEKFVELFATGEYVINDHHHPVSTLCGGCDISWDYIVKQETMDEDNEFLLKLVKAPENVHVGNKNQIGFVKKDPFSYLVNYCQFSDEVIDKIEEYYSQDFLLYSYDRFDREDCADKLQNSEILRRYRNLLDEKLFW